MINERRTGGAEHTGAKTLWSDADRTRQFLIPDALALPAGEFQLRTATGRTQCVDPDALPPFEVSREEAQIWAKAQLGEVTRRLKAGLKDTLFGGQDGDHGQGGERPDAGASEQASATPGLNLLADITGTPRERLSEDYRAVGRALRDYLTDAAKTTGDALSGDPEREREARERMREWAETLRAHGIPTAQVEEPAATSDGAGADDRGGSGGPSNAATDERREKKS